MAYLPLLSVPAQLHPANRLIAGMPPETGIYGIHNCFFLLRQIVFCQSKKGFVSYRRIIGFIYFFTSQNF